MADQFGAVKQNLDTKVVAVRTVWPPDSLMAWLVADPNTGGHWAPQKEIDAGDWVDMAQIVDVT